MVMQTDARSDYREENDSGENKQRENACAERAFECRRLSVAVLVKLGERERNADVCEDREYEDSGQIDT